MNEINGKRRNKNKKAGKIKHVGKTIGISGILFACLCVGILVSTISLQDVIENPLDPREWMNNALAQSEHDPGGDNGGYIYFMAYPHSATPKTTYASNLSAATAYEESDTINSECNNETPHSTPTDYVLQIRLNDTTSYNTSSSLWMPSWVHANITVDFDFASDVSWTNMSLIEVANNSDFAWYNCYLNNAGSGYTITNNEKWNATVNVTLWW